MELSLKIIHVDLDKSRQDFVNLEIDYKKTKIENEQLSHKLNNQNEILYSWDESDKKILEQMNKEESKNMADQSYII